MNLRKKYPQLQLLLKNYIKGELFWYIHNFLSDRTAQVFYQGFLTQINFIQNGLLQSSPISQIIFNALTEILINNLNIKGIQMWIYAYDIALITQYNITQNIQKALDIISDTSS